MSQQIFPSLIGEAYPIVKKPIHSTKIQTAQAGMEVRIADWAQERYHWTIPFGYLNHDAAIATADLQILEGLFNLVHGRFDSFLYSDPTDKTVVGSNFGTGNGTTLTFQLSRTRGASTHWVYNVDATSAAPVIKVNGVVKTLTTDYTISASGLVTFTSAPGNGLAITVDFSYYFRVRFDTDELELTNECGPYWSIKEVPLFEVAGNR